MSGHAPKSALEAPLSSGFVCVHLWLIRNEFAIGTGTLEFGFETSDFENPPFASVAQKVFRSPS
jgi:hypothetical protein